MIGVARQYNKYATMKKFTIIYNKVKHPVEADTLPNFQKAVEEAINVPPQNLKIIKPMVKVAYRISSD